MNTWVYLTDLAPQGTIMNLDTGEQRRIMSSAVKGRAPAGLRRYVLEEQDGGTFRETGDQLPLTAELLDDIEEVYDPPNSWNFDWPLMQAEEQAACIGPNGQDLRAQVVERLERMMSHHPYDFQITGIQRRFLMYYSDGSYQSQQRFDRLIPRPSSYPFRRSGALRRKYDWVYNSGMRDAGVPFPQQERSLYGELSPLLYMGPAWVVRFTLDDHDVLLERCRVYVTDEADFICSDWCQRHDYTSYNTGINLQQGIYSFDGWVTGPCVTKNVDAGWTPKSVTYKRMAVRELAKRAPAPVPAFETVLAKASAAVSKYSKAHSLANPDVGPITADVLAEAAEAAANIFAAAPEPKPAPVALVAFDEPQRVPYCESDDYDGDPEPDTDIGYVCEYRADGEHVRVGLYYRPNSNGKFGGTEYRTVSIEDLVPPDTFERFKVSDESPTGFYYDGDDEPLNTHWWLYSAARHYRDTMLAGRTTQLASILLEA